MRHVVGYDCFETEQELTLLRSIYEDLRLYVIFFQPVLKLVGKDRVDGKTIKRYDQAATPFRPALASDQVSLEIKARLTDLYLHLNPVVLRNSIDQIVALLWKLVG